MGDDPVLTLALLEEQVYPILETIIPALPGWCSVEKAKRLARLTADIAPPLAVELGVFGGRSLVAIAFGCKAAGGGRVEGIDPYERAASLEGTQDQANMNWWGQLDHDAVLAAAERGIQKSGVADAASIVRAKSLDAVSRYLDGSLRLLHQDSNHAEEVSCAEVRAYAPKMALGGFWVMDDTNWPSTAKAQWLLVEMGFVLVESHAQTATASAWEIYQAVGAEVKR